MTERSEGVRQELLDLKGPDGTINPRSAVQWASDNQDSWLYASLEWRNRVAAEEYRVWQVRQLIAVYILPEGPREFVSLTIDRATGGYRETAEVLRREDLRMIMLKDALAELDRMRERYQALQQLADVWAARARIEDPKPLRPRRGRPPGSARKRGEEART
jgi:hypothetical protein